MPFSHFRGGLKPPLPCTGGFTLNGFTPPVDALRHVRSRKPFRMCSCEKCVRNSPAICTCKTIGLKLPWNQHLEKNRGGAPPASAIFLLLSATRCTMSGELKRAKQALIVKSRTAS